MLSLFVLSCVHARRGGEHHPFVFMNSENLSAGLALLLRNQVDFDVFKDIDRHTGVNEDFAGIWIGIEE